MEKDYTTIASIQTFFDGILRGTLDDNLFFDAPPQTISDSWKSFAVVDLGTEISGNNAMSRGMVRIMIYVRPITSGVGNVALAQQKETSLMSIVKGVSDSHYVLDHLGVFSDFDTDTGFNVAVHILRIRIL